MRIDRPEREPDVSIDIVGQPKTAGSKDPHMRRGPDGTVKMWVSDQAGDAGKAWRNAIGYAARTAMGGRALLDAPLYVEITILRQRGGGHFGQGRNRDKLLPSAPRYPHVKPDAIKLARAIEDGLNEIAWVDDSRNVSVHVEKVFAERGEPSGARVRIWELPATVGPAREMPVDEQLALSA